MNRFVLSVAVLISTSVAANAAANFQGDFFLTEATQPCLDNGWSVGNYGRVRYQPPNIDGNDKNSRFGIHFNTFAIGYFVKGKITKKFKKAVAGAVAASSFSQGNAKMRYTTMDPSNVNANTQNIILVVEIKDYDGNPGCNVTLGGALTKRP